MQFFFRIPVYPTAGKAMVLLVNIRQAFAWHRPLSLDSASLPTTPLFFMFLIGKCVLLVRVVMHLIHPGSET